MMVTEKACKNCRFIVEEGDSCPRCSQPLTRDWQGYLLVIQPGESAVAKKMGITVEGRYALRVR